MPCLVMFLLICSSIVGSCCILTTDLGTSSRCVLTDMCHDFILMRSSKVNSNINLPSVNTLVYIGFPYCVTIVH